MNILIAVIFGGCKKSDTYFRDTGMKYTPQRTITGRITDLNDQPLPDAMVSLGNKSATTNIHGLYTIKYSQFNTDRLKLTVTRPGYFKGSKTFFANSNSTNYLNIKLIPKTVTGTFAASSGGVIRIPGFVTILIDAGSVINEETGDPYDGNVTVSAFYLDPADPMINDYMPGDLLGITINNEKRILQSFGMLSVEMNDGTGERLQLASGKKAVIRLSIPADFQLRAPDTIPLWYFDEINGWWKEEGFATREGNNYTGAVSHFSFWNCDLPAKYVNLCLALADLKRRGLANYYVSISSDAYGTRGGYTGSEGTICGLIPASEAVILTVYDQCHEIVYSDNIGPFNADVDLGTIVITGPGSQINITVSGNVVTCNNSPVKEGYVIVNNGISYFTAPVTDGNFEISFPVCPQLNNPVTLFAIDEINLMQSAGLTININSGNQDIGQLTACLAYYNL